MEGVYLMWESSGFEHCKVWTEVGTFGFLLRSSLKEGVFNSKLLWKLPANGLQLLPFLEICPLPGRWFSSIEGWHRGQKHIFLALRWDQFHGAILAPEPPVGSGEVSHQQKLYLFFLLSYLSPFPYPWLCNQIYYTDIIICKELKWKRKIRSSVLLCIPYSPSDIIFSINCCTRILIIGTLSRKPGLG